MNLLAGYLDAKPSELQSAQDTSGKPRLAEPGTSWLRFNLSRAGGLAVFGVVRDCEVGIDVEYARHDFPIEAVAGGILSPMEFSGLAAMPIGQKVEEFFAMWTRREAYLKVLSVGWGGSEPHLGAPLPVSEVGGVSDLDHSDSFPREWSLAAFSAGRACAAAVAVAGRRIQVPAAARPFSNPSG
jgi:4'-phosphopantetheinyl transferase